MKTLYLHIGTHHTDAHAVQAYMAAHREALLALGLLYPTTAVQAGGHHPLARATGIGGQQVDKGYVASTIASLVAEAGDSSADKLLLSAEGFCWSHNVAALAALAEHFDVRVVAYVRRQDRYLESVYRQHVLNYGLRFAGTIYQFALRYNFYGTLNYRQLAWRWENVFGRNAIVLRPYGTPLVEPDTGIDLLQVMGVPAADCPPAVAPEGAGAARLPMAAIPYLARLNSLPLGEEQHAVAIRWLQEQLPVRAGARLLSNAEAQLYYTRFRHSNAFVFERYLDCEDVPFDLHDGAMEPASYIDPASLDQTLLAALQQAVEPAQDLPRSWTRRLFERLAGGGQP